MIPHITNEIKERILSLATEDVDVVITEVGGTVGDIEILPFLEAIRQFRKDVGRDNVFYVHVTLVPFIGPAGEQKTKPTQHSVTELRSRGIQPDAIVCRSDRPIHRRLKEKISQLCDVPEEGIVSAVDAGNLYEIPLVLHDEGLDDYVCRVLHLDQGEPDLTAWKALVRRVEAADVDVTIGLVGKYVNLPDAYLSVVEALKHGGYGCGARVGSTGSRPTRPKGCSPRAASTISTASSCPAASGSAASRARSPPPATHASTTCRTSGCASACSARSSSSRDVCGLAGANSSEFDPSTPHPVIDLMDEQRDVVDMGGTMRLGAWPARLLAGHARRAAYGDEEVVYERHRHRYEVNNRYRAQLEEAGLICSGTSPDGRLVEYVELAADQHPFFVATQAHPEFKSRPDRPHPLFAAFIEASKFRAEGRAPRFPFSERPVANVS